MHSLFGIFKTKLKSINEVKNILPTSIQALLGFKKILKIFEQFNRLNQSKWGIKDFYFKNLQI